MEIRLENLETSPCTECGYHIGTGPTTCALCNSERARGRNIKPKQEKEVELSSEVKQKIDSIITHMKEVGEKRKRLRNSDSEPKQQDLIN